MPRYVCYGGPLDGASVTLAEGVERWYASGDPSPPIAMGPAEGLPPELPPAATLTVYAVRPHPTLARDVLLYEGEDDGER